MLQPAIPVLALDRVSVAFDAARGRTVAVHDVSLHVHAGESVALVGESGCGKSVTAHSVLRLLHEPPAHVSGAVWLNTAARVDVMKLAPRALREVRGKQIAMVFQDPMSSLNPVMTVGAQVAEVVRIHERTSRAAANARAVQMLTRVGIASATQRAQQYPHELSGGMRQRVMIAMALVCGPAVLVADEPTTALDVTIQAQILTLLRSLKAELGMALVLITHDLGVVAELCDRVYVMYAGQIVETASAVALFESPAHPYTAGLLNSLPKLDGPRGGRLAHIPGTVPAPGAWPTGCRFAPRCDRVVDGCTTRMPELVEIGARSVRCHNPHLPRAQT